MNLCPLKIIGNPPKKRIISRQFTTSMALIFKAIEITCFDKQIRKENWIFPKEFGSGRSY